MSWAWVALVMAASADGDDDGVLSGESVDEAEGFEGSIAQQMVQGFAVNHRGPGCPLRQGRRQEHDHIVRAAALEGQHGGDQIAIAIDQERRIEHTRSQVGHGTVRGTFAVKQMTHPEAVSGVAGDTSVWDELRCSEFCKELEKASAPEVLAMAKTLARAVMVSHPAAIRLMIREAIRAGSGYSEAQTAALAAGVTQATEKPS